MNKLLAEINNLEDVSLKNELLCLLNKISNNPLLIEDIWYLMDFSWDKHACDSKNIDSSALGKFYSDPVWVLNGMWIEQDDVSMKHRIAVRDALLDNPGVKKILDYGGGFGTVARLIAEKRNDIQVDILEPFPSEYSKKKNAEFGNIKFVNDISKGYYDFLISMDVLEHVINPIDLLLEINQSVKKDGILVIANCFYPVIKCHLPQNFHFRYTFRLFARMMGLKFIGACRGAEHALIYKKVDENPCLNMYLVKFLERVSRSLFPVMNIMFYIYKSISPKYYFWRVK
jgi:2-polyprenyl-6-hydroxyphenyl methylase/3-demethylubiquinone-9 3-methyltransferase